MIMQSGLISTTRYISTGGATISQLIAAATAQQRKVTTELCSGEWWNSNQASMTVIAHRIDNPHVSETNSANNDGEYNMQKFAMAVEELRSFIVSEKLKLNVEVGEDEISITHDTAIGRRLKITCVAQGIYRLKDAQDGGVQRVVYTEHAWWSGKEGPFDQSEMLANAKRWMNSQFGR